MVFLALNLTRAGVGDYWDDVDRWVRNTFAESQMLSTEFPDKIPDQYITTPEQAEDVARDLRLPLTVGPVTYPHHTTENVAERTIGSFLGWMRAKDVLHVVETKHGPKLLPLSVMHCCTANGARTLYYGRYAR